MFFVIQSTATPLIYTLISCIRIAGRPVLRTKAKDQGHIHTYNIRLIIIVRPQLYDKIKAIIEIKLNIHHS